MKNDWRRWAAGLALSAACTITPSWRTRATRVRTSRLPTNKLDVKVMVMNIQWYDYDKGRWRDPVDFTFESQVIQPSGVKTYLKNLDGVKKDKMKLKIKYSKAKKNILDKWDEGLR